MTDFLSLSPVMGKQSRVGLEPRTFHEPGVEREDSLLAYPITPRPLHGLRHQSLRYTHRILRLGTVATDRLTKPAVTQLARAGFAVALAPFIEKGAQAITARLKLSSVYVAYTLVTACCLAIAATMFGGILLLRP